MSTGFDYAAFEAAEFRFPEKKIPVPGLKDFFGENEPKEWTIRGLTGLELAQVDAAVENRVMDRQLEIIKKALTGPVRDVKAGYDELVKAIEIPDQYIRWLKYVQYGSVPQCPEEVCVKLAMHHGGTLKRLAYEISKLSAIGADLVK